MRQNRKNVFFSTSIVHYVICKRFNRKYFKMMAITEEKKEDLKDLTELLPVSAVNYYNNLLVKFEKYKLTSKMTTVLTKMT